MAIISRHLPQTKITFPDTVHLASVQHFLILVYPTKHQYTLQLATVQSSMRISFLIHACHFLKLVLGVFWLIQSSLTELARMQHLATDLQRFIHNRIVKCFTSDIVVIVVTASADKDEVALHEKCQHFVKRWLHAWAVDPQMKYFLRLLV